MPRKQIKELDVFFTKHILSPYLKSVFDNLTSIGNQGKSYLNLDKTKQYFRVSEFIGSRFMTIINANGDQRIDFDEWFEFFLKIMMGSP